MIVYQYLKTYNYLVERKECASIDDALKEAETHFLTGEYHPLRIFKGSLDIITTRGADTVEEENIFSSSDKIKQEILKRKGNPQ